MYLKKIFIKNIGAIEKLDISMPFKENGDPKPLIIVGENGTGKSILLSHIADAMLEFRQNAFKTDDILRRNSNGGYSYFKTLGGGNTRIGASNSISYLQFKSNDKKYEYLETTGEITDLELKGNISECTLNIDKEKGKQITNLENKELESTFLYDSYCYFPPNRFEMPHWINKVYDSGKNKITHKQRYSGKLDKTFIIESCQDEIAQWILDVFLDASVIAKQTEDNSYNIKNVDARTRSQLVKSKENIEQILTKILKRDVELYLNYRNHPLSRIKVIDGTNKQEIIPSLNNLSTGQSVLFNLFCSIIKHGEKDEANIKYNGIIEGIAIIDEVDLHLHSDLQTDILPELIELFPKIQFIITTHSPLFLLGMEKKFGTNDIEIREMPTGDVITADRFREFDKAYDYFKETKKFEEDLQKIMQAQDDKPVLFTEGITDTIILSNAYKVLYGDNTVFEIFKPDKEDKGSAKHLNQFFNNPRLSELCKRKTVIAMFDFDEEGWNQFKGLKNYSTYDGNNTIKKHDSSNSFAFLLPVPDNRKNDASEELEDRSYMPIEFLFEDDKIRDICDSKKHRNNTTLLHVKNSTDCKKTFAKNTKNFTTEDFKNFKAIFELINKIIKNNS